MMEDSGHGGGAQIMVKVLRSWWKRSGLGGGAALDLLKVVV
jgi:hypothetical protein